MPTTEVITEERKALLQLVDDLAERWPTGDDVTRTLSEARRVLVDSGLWALGLPEACGGGGADLETVQAAIARVSGHRAALGVAMAHLHAAGEALCADHRRRLAEVAVGGSIFVAEARSGIARAEFGPGALVLLDGDGCRLAPAEAVSRGPELDRTGLIGLPRAPVDIDPGGVLPLEADPDLVAGRLRAGLLAVAAGLADAAHRHAAGYTAQRVQFGAPLDALPTMRERLAELRGHATSLLGLAVRPAIPGADTPYLLRDGADRAMTACRLAVQCLGGYGYLEEYPVAALFRDAVSLRGLSR